MHSCSCHISEPPRSVESIRSTSDLAFYFHTISITETCRMQRIRKEALWWPLSLHRSRSGTRGPVAPTNIPHVCVCCTQCTVPQNKRRCELCVDSLNPFAAQSAINHTHTHPSFNEHVCARTCMHRWQWVCSCVRAFVFAAPWRDYL